MRPMCPSPSAPALRDPHREWLHLRGQIWEGGSRLVTQAPVTETGFHDLAMFASFGVACHPTFVSGLVGSSPSRGSDFTLSVSAIGVS